MTVTATVVVVAAVLALLGRVVTRFGSKDDRRPHG
jgi:hypothetical protein